jgi:hypothetical protein
VQGFAIVELIIKLKTPIAPQGGLASNLTLVRTENSDSHVVMMQSAEERL